MIETNYSRAWLQFRKSEEFKRTADAMEKKGIKQRYASNILRTAFEAGWNASGVKIYIIKQP
jgi:hypothetical protein